MRVRYRFAVASLSLAALAGCGSSGAGVRTDGASGTDGAAGKLGSGGAAGGGAGGGANAGGQSGVSSAGRGGEGGGGSGGQGICAPVGQLVDVDVGWCAPDRACAVCSWKFGGASVALGTPPATPCVFPSVTCPDSRGSADAGPAPVCAVGGARSYDGALVQFIAGYPNASACYGLDHQGDGSNPDFDFETLPCALGAFICVDDCSRCPGRLSLP